MMSSNYQMVLVLFQISKIILNISLKNFRAIKMNNRLVFKLKERYKLELQTSQIMNYLVAEKN